MEEGTNILTCMCCGYTKEFKDGEEAFNAGWMLPRILEDTYPVRVVPARGLFLDKQINIR